MILVCALIGAVPTVPYLTENLRACAKGETVYRVLRPVIAAVLLLASTAFLVAGSFNPFLYWQF